MLPVRTKCWKEEKEEEEKRDCIQKQTKERKREEVVADTITAIRRLTRK